MAADGTIVRRLGPGDESLAAEIARRFGQGTIPRRGHFARYLADREHNLLVAALADGVPIGFARACWLARLDTPRPQLLLYEIEVAAAHRRRGVGRRLIEALEEACRQRHALEMLVLTEAGNAAAMGLYQATGAVRPNGDDVLLIYAYP